ncbi:MAG: type III secretion system inner membrane ring subunit SctD [Chlamydiota bacterium]
MIARLVAENGQLKGLTLTLSKAVEWHLGRDPDANQLVLQDASVSRQHALIRKSDQGYLLENLSLTNPIFVNGKILSNPTLLKEGDQIKIGGTTFAFKAEADAKAPSLKESLTAPLKFDDKDKTLDQVPSYDTVFEEVLTPTADKVDLSLRQRWLLKIIGGPQSGAEFSMEKGRSYIIGSDATLADIILYDLSVSRKHAKITIQDDESCVIEDLGSRNGVLIDGIAIAKPTVIKGSEVINLGTTSFIIVDREKASETILSTPPEKESVGAASSPAAVKAEVSLLKKLFASKETQVITLSLGIVVLFAAFGISSLFSTTTVVVDERDYHSEIANVMKGFPEVSFSYNRKLNQLLLVGHVLAPVDKTKLEYALNNLGFVGVLDDSNIIIDQNIWMQMNTLISQNPSWNAVSMYASKPGLFVVSGYLKTRKEAGLFSDWLNLNFNYLDRLNNQVVVEEDLIANIASQLFTGGFNGVAIDVTSGELTLTGFIPQDKEASYDKLVAIFKTTPGIRGIKNFVTPLTPSEAVVDLTDNYKVTGFSTKDNTNISIVINGQILSRGDQINGMTISSIQEHTIFLEKNGLKFKIQYNS